MRYFYSLNIPYHWNDICMMIDENYAHEYEHNDVVVMAVHHHQSIEQIKESNPGHNKIIIYQLEPLCKDHWWNEEYIISRIKDADEIWDYDLDNIEILKKYGIDAKFKPFLYCNNLKKIENREEPDIDVFFYGTSTPYRSKIIEILTNHGLIGRKTVWLWNYGNGSEIFNEFISRSKIILNLNTTDSSESGQRIQKQSRIYYALINDKCVVSEKSVRNYYGDLIVEVEKDDLLKTIEYLLEEDRWKQYSNVSDKFKQLNIDNIVSENYQEKKTNKIAIFYHVYQANDWKKLYQEQINSLIVSGLYDQCDLIHIGINGDQELPFVLDKMRVQYNENKILEANTLQSLWEFCKENPDHRVMYLHTKGLTHTTEYNCSITSNAWRIYLEYFTIHKWKTCLGDLEFHDCVGAEWVDETKFFDSEIQEFTYEHNPHYSGNFWWANASYISNLDIDFIYNEDKGLTRWKSEIWIGTKNPNYKSYHNSNINFRDTTLYDTLYSPNYYIDKN